MTNYLILGSTSFAGASFVNYLLNKGEKVIGISRSKENHPVMLPYFNNVNKNNFTFYQYDVNHHIEEIKAVIQKHKPNYIIDFAGQGMVAESWHDPAQWYTTNIVAKVKLHHFLLHCDFLTRYIRVSTPEVYGQTDAALTEETHFNPSTPYAVSHAAIDMSLQAYFKQYQFPMILTRFANFYGPFQQLYRIIPRTIIYALTHRKLQLHGGGTSERMFIYADDISEALFKAIHIGKLGEIYHFTNEPMISVRGLVEKICVLLNIHFENLVEIADERAGKDSKYEMVANKSKASLGWRPAVSLEEGLINTIDWVKNNLPTLQTLNLEYVHKP